MSEGCIHAHFGVYSGFRGSFENENKFVSFTCPTILQNLGGCTSGTTWVLTDHGYFTGPEVGALRGQHRCWSITAVHDRPWTV